VDPEVLYPDSEPDPCCVWPKLSKFTVNENVIFKNKKAVYLSEGIIKASQTPAEALQKEQHIAFFLHFIRFMAFLDPYLDPEAGSTHLIVSGSNPNQDPTKPTD
jgi:hypothetical protein